MYWYTAAARTRTRTNARKAQFILLVSTCRAPPTLPYPALSQVKARGRWTKRVGGSLQLSSARRWGQRSPAASPWEALSSQTMPRCPSPALAHSRRKFVCFVFVFFVKAQTVDLSAHVHRDPGRTVSRWLRVIQFLIRSELERRCVSSECVSRGRTSAGACSVYFTACWLNLKKQKTKLRCRNALSFFFFSILSIFQSKWGIFFILQNINNWTSRNIPSRISFQSMHLQCCCFFFFKYINYSIWQTYESSIFLMTLHGCLQLKCVLLRFALTASQSCLPEKKGRKHESECCCCVCAGAGAAAHRLPVEVKEMFAAENRSLN